MVRPGQNEIKAAEALMTEHNLTSGDDVTLGELRRTLGRIELRQEHVVQDHEIRLRRVERWVYGIPPALLIAAGSIAMAIIRGGP